MTVFQIIKLGINQDSITETNAFLIFALLISEAMPEPYARQGYRKVTLHHEWITAHWEALLILQFFLLKSKVDFLYFSKCFCPCVLDAHSPRFHPDKARQISPFDTNRNVWLTMSSILYFHPWKDIEGFPVGHP